MKKKGKFICRTIISNVRTAISTLRLGQISKRWKKERYPVPNVIARISGEFLMASDFAPEKPHLRGVQALAALVHQVLVLLVGDKKYKISHK